MLRTLNRSLLYITVYSAGIALLLSLDRVPFFRGAFGWRWPYEPVGLARALLLSGFALLYLLVGWWLMQRNRARWSLMWAFMGVVVVSVLVVWMRNANVGYELFVRTASGVTTGPHLAAAEVDWRVAWRDWTPVMESYQGRSVHVALSPPGLPMWYAALNGLIGVVPGLARWMQSPLLWYQCHNYALLAYTPAQWASAWFGMLMPLWAAFTVFPLYRVSRRIVDGVWARWTVVLWAFVPALSAFAPSWNTLYPFFSLLAFWMFLIGLQARRRGAGWFVGAGLVTGLMTFANFSLVPFGLLMGAFAIAYYVLHERYLEAPPRTWRPVLVLVWYGLGVFLIWFVYWLVSGETPFDLLAVAMGEHLSLERPYVPWLWLHFQEWVLLTGLPLVALWLAMSWRKARPHLGNTGRVLGIASMVTLALLLVSGTARGETGRVWLFLSPFVLIAGVDGLGRLLGLERRAFVPWMLLGGSQAFMMVALVSTWGVMGAPDMTPPPSPPGALTAERPGGATFETAPGAIRLQTWDAQSNGERISLHLNWQTDAQLTDPYWFSALVVSPDGVPAPSATDWQPLDTVYPTTCWRPGEVVGDTVTLPLPDDAEPGDWWLSLSSFTDEDGSGRLSVTLPDGSTDEQVGLGPVAVE